MQPTQVGSVAGLWRYPVKSMAAESLDTVEISWHGVTGDRRYAFVREGLKRSGFPWLTIRERSDLGSYEPMFADPEHPDDSAVVVRTPSGDELDVVDPALAAELGHGARVIKQGRGTFDSSPLSLITTQTIAALADMVDRELDVRRFRPNLVVDAAGRDPFQEDSWVGSMLRIGELLMRVDRRDERCAIVTVDPETSERDPSFLRAIAQQRQACLGVYGSPVQPGRVAVGDAVVLSPSDA